MKQNSVKQAPYKGQDGINFEAIIRFSIIDNAP